MPHSVLLRPPFVEDGWRITSRVYGIPWIGHFQLREGQGVGHSLSVGNDMSLPDRLTVRLLLFDPSKSLLLMAFDDSSIRGGQSADITRKWATLGGRMEEGETVLDTAAREAREETGQDDITIGPAVWYGEQVLKVNSVPNLFKETFIVGHMKDERLSSEHWTEEERGIIQDMKWWTLSELETTNEIILPRALPHLLPPILNGEYPRILETIDLSA